MQVPKVRSCYLCMLPSRHLRISMIHIYSSSLFRPLHLQSASLYASIMLLAQMFLFYVRFRAFSFRRAQPCSTIPSLFHYSKFNVFSDPLLSLSLSPSCVDVWLERFYLHCDCFLPITVSQRDFPEMSLSNVHSIGEIMSSGSEYGVGHLYTTPPDESPVDLCLCARLLWCVVFNVDEEYESWCDKKSDTRKI